ncbi:MAG: hypothetical protein AAF721_16605 [Myxococcota bacterium]
MPPPASKTTLRYDCWQGDLAMTLSRWRRILMLGGAVALSLAGCKEEDDGAANDTGTADETGADDDADSVGDDGMDGMDDMDDSGCVPGALMCSCAEGVCSGVLFCVEDMCVQGPDVEFDDEFPDVLAGLRVPLEVEAEGETITWSQTAGPAVELLTDQGPNTEINIPADAGDGETITMTVEVQLNGVTLSDSMDITIREAVFENVFPDVTAPEQLGTTDGLAFNGAGMWVVSNEGFVSHMSPGDNDGDEPVPPGFVEAFDVGGLPAGANFLENELMLIANTMLTEVQTFNTVSGTVGTYFDQIDGGGTLGAANFLLIDGNDGDVLLTNHLDGQLIYYDTGNDNDDDPIPPSTVVMADDLGVNPNAMAFGPEGPGIVYLGVEDTIIRIPYEDGMIGMTSTYLDLAGMCGEPDGIMFDEGGNMWVGCPATNSLFVAQYVGGPDGETEVSRSWSDVGTGISRFANLQFGGGDFAGRSLYWTNLEDATVGVLGVGLQGRNN